MDFDEYADTPLYCTVKETSIFSSDHIPEFSDVKRMCRVCYLKEKKQCNVYTCICTHIHTYMHVYALHPSAMCIYILQLQKIAFKNGILLIFIESIGEIW